jgi:predicted extracellular nuclease
VAPRTPGHTDPSDGTILEEESDTAQPSSPQTGPEEEPHAMLARFELLLPVCILLLGAQAATADLGPCGDPAVAIHEVQGSGAVGPLVGSSLVIEGVVVGDFQDVTAGLGGFFVQEEDADADLDPGTSEGIFVYDAGGPGVSAGDVVRVEGVASEFFGLTELSGISDLAICDQPGAATAATLRFPTPTPQDLERFEGMLIHVPHPLFVTGSFEWGRFGEVDLSAGGRLFSPTSLAMPGPLALALGDLNDRSRILLDDGSRVWHPAPLPPYIGEGNTLRIGDRTPQLTGVLSYAFGHYRVQPTRTPRFTRVDARQPTPPAVGGTLKIASFNVGNYFTTLDDAGRICGPSGGLACRGADDALELSRQREKLVDAIAGLDADILGLIEVENDAGQALQDLVEALNAALGAGTYAFVDTGVVGDDAVKVAFLYKPATASIVGSFAILDSRVSPLFNDRRNRPALAQTFERRSNGARFTAVVNHLKSKGSPCTSPSWDDPLDPDAGDGQGHCNGTRTRAAQALASWLATDPTESADPDFLILGDLNAYALEDPITTLEQAGYTDLIEAFVGPSAYSYVFDGEAGPLDHALANASLVGQVTRAAVWHINADEPRVLDYDGANQPGLYAPDRYRSSDHDPLLVGLDLASDAAQGHRACSILGNDRRAWFRDVDLYTFSGTQGDHVSVTLDADPAGPQRGRIATLILRDRIRGVFLRRSDRGRLPNSVAATLPADGSYDVLVLEQPVFQRRRRFRGAYCRTLESSGGSTLEPTAWVESP